MAEAGEELACGVAAKCLAPVGPHKLHVLHHAGGDLQLPRHAAVGGHQLQQPRRMVVLAGDREREAPHLLQRCLALCRLVMMISIVCAQEL